jgi:peptidoglycan/LPS O-acetylase OafA/YrhL
MGARLAYVERELVAAHTQTPGFRASVLQLWTHPVVNHAVTPRHSTSPHAPMPSSARLRYLPALDGLRALAVLAVLFYHADISWTPGGFLGVDVFFVLSGYLITALLLAEWNSRGTIGLARFWQRRARRLLPALFVLIAVTLAFAVVWLPEEVARLRGDALAALAYVENWHLIFKQESYFEQSGRPSLFQHLWSLAIEEQFYLVWPPMLVLLLRRWGRRGVLLAAIAGAAVSVALMAWGYTPDEDPSRVYYGADTRAFALLIGAALACTRLPVRSGRRDRLVRLPDLAAIAALAGLAAAVYFLDEYHPLLYRGGFVIVAVLAAVLIAALAHPRATLSQRLLGSMPMRWIGTRSYAIYLWHWPVFMATRPDLDIALHGWPLLALRLATTATLAELSYRFVEAPIRAGLLGHAWRSLRQARGAHRWQLGLQWIGATVLGLALTTVLGVVVVEARPPAPPPELAIVAVQDTPISATPTHSTAPTASAAASPAPTAAFLPSVDSVGAFELPEYRIPSAAPRSPTTSSPGPAALARALPPLAAPAPKATAAPLPTPAPPAVAPPEAPAATAVPEIAAAPTGLPAPAGQPAEPPAEAPQPAPAAHVTAIGDSVMVGASRQLREAIEYLSIDAAVSRQAKTAVALLRAKREAGQLGDVVVVHIGTNGPFSARQLDEMMQTLADVRRVVFVNVKVPRRWEAANNTVIAEGVARYSNARLADWHTATADHPELFARDGIHPQRAGARLYAELIAAAINTP